MPATRTADRSPTLRPFGSSALLVADVDATLAELDHLDPEDRAALLWPEPRRACRTPRVPSEGMNQERSRPPRQPAQEAT